MFDNFKDPFQMDNLAGKPEHAELQKKLDDMLSTELKRIGDDFKPRKYYLDKWGYSVGKHGAIGYRD
jgi:hypothetical protein